MFFKLLRYFFYFVNFVLFHVIPMGGTIAMFILLFKGTFPPTTIFIYYIGGGLIVFFGVYISMLLEDYC